MHKQAVAVVVFLSVACHQTQVETGPGAAANPVTGSYDVVIENGRIVDGTGAPWFYGDVGIRSDRIAAIVPRGMLHRAASRQRIDASGLVVAPGFIDIQDQSGGQLLAGDGRQLGKLTQGVTTGILGEGSTPAPLNPATLPVNASDLQKRFAEPHGFDAWLSAMQAHGISQNVGSFVGAGTIRQFGMAERMGAATGAALDSMRGAVRPAGVLITSLRQADNQKYIGKRLSEIAQMKGGDHLDAAMDLILSEHSRVETTYFLMSEDNVKLQLQQPWMKIGTDAGGPDPDSVRALVHPRTFGNYPRILGKYVREEHVIPLEDAIRKMTSAVADRLSIHDRGVLKPGMFADIVVFDPNTIADRATYEQPKQLSVGVRHVWVNGVQVIRDGSHTGAKPGRALHGPGWNR